MYVPNLIGTPATTQQSPAATPGAQGDLQAQWAEYYRSLGYGAYYGQQGGGAAPAQGQQPPTTTAANGDQKVCSVVLS